MANRRQSYPDNVPGDFFVDTTCIDCGTCRHVAPETFAEAADHSYVQAQPDTATERRKAYRALLCCPTGSIGSEAPAQAREVMEDFPLPIEGGVYYCGFASPKSFGASSYFIHHPDGNWLIDSPKFLPHLVERFEQLGGIRHVFLTNRDDVADADRYAARFGAERWIHEADRGAQPEAERTVSGDDPVEVAPGFLVIPTPGHTRGSMVLLHDGFLFSGDHLWGLPHAGKLGASPSVCWYSWPEQTRSMEKLLAYRFDWVLPGHGAPLHLESEAMHAALADLVRRMERHARTHPV